LTLDREIGRVRIEERRTAIAEDQVRAVVGETPALARILHRADELAVEVVDEHLVLGPGELENLIVQDREAFAKDLGALVEQARLFSGGRKEGEAGTPADRAGAFIEFAVAPLESLREADIVANDLAGDFEAQRDWHRTFGGDGRSGQRGGECQ